MAIADYIWLNRCIVSGSSLVFEFDLVKLEIPTRYQVLHVPNFMASIAVLQHKTNSVSTPGFESSPQRLSTISLQVSYYLGQFRAHPNYSHP